MKSNHKEHKDKIIKEFGATLDYHEFWSNQTINFSSNMFQWISELTSQSSFPIFTNIFFNICRERIPTESRRMNPRLNEVTLRLTILSHALAIDRIRRNLGQCWLRYNDQYQNLLELNLQSNVYCSWCKCYSWCLRRISLSARPITYVW